jgi:hypothetical protein
MDAADVVVDRDVWPPGPDANDPVVVINILTITAEIKANLFKPSPLFH